MRMGTPTPSRHNNLLLPHAQLLLIIITTTIILAICSSPNHHLTASALPQDHALSPAPAPSPSHHHHHHHYHHHHHHQTHHVMPPSPANSPVSPPQSAVHPPTQPPAYTPVKPPAVSPAPGPAPHALPPRKLVAVQGVVYCKNCSYSGVDTLLGASPLSGVKVELRCKNTKYMLKKASTTDKNGFFFLQAPKHITTYGAHKCLVFLSSNSSSGGGACDRATNLNGGVSGAFLFYDKSLAPPPKPKPFTVYTVGPFAFEPSKCYRGRSKLTVD